MGKDETRALEPQFFYHLAFSVGIILPCCIWNHQLPYLLLCKVRDFLGPLQNIMIKVVIPFPNKVLFSENEICKFVEISFLPCRTWRNGRWKWPFRWRPRSFNHWRCQWANLSAGRAFGWPQNCQRFVDFFFRDFQGYLHTVSLKRRQQTAKVYISLFWWYPFLTFFEP